MNKQSDSDSQTTVGFETIHSLLKRGDIISIRGYPGTVECPFFDAFVDERYLVIKRKDKKRRVNLVCKRD